MGLEPEVVPERRARFLETRLPELWNSCVATRISSRQGRASPPPLRSGARHRSASVSSAARAPSARAPRTGRFAGRPPRPAAASPARQPQRRQYDQGSPAIAFGMCRRFTCASSCATTTPSSPGEKRPSSSVSHRTTCEDGPNPAVNAFAWSVHEDTSWTTDGASPGTPSIRSSRTASVAESNGRGSEGDRRGER